MALTFVDTIVFGPSKIPTTDTELDLSSHVGANKGLVFIKTEVANNDGFMGNTCFKPKDESGNWNISDVTGDFGTGIVKCNVATDIFMVCQMTNSEGKLEIQQNHIVPASAEDVTLTLDSYDLSYTPYVGSSVHNGTFNVGDNTLDLSAVTGSEAASVLLRIEGGSGASSDHLDFKDPDAPGSFTGESGARSTQLSNGDVQTVLISTKDDGTVIVDSSSGTANYTIHVMLYKNTTGGFVRDRTRVYDNGADGFEVPPSAYTGVGSAPLDLSSKVGSNRVEVELEIECNAPTSTDSLGFRPSDESGEWLRSTNRPAGISTVYDGDLQNVYVRTRTGPDGIVQWKSATLSPLVKVDLLSYVPVSYIDSLTPSYLGLRVTFNTGMLKDSELLDSENYSISALDANSVSSGVISVTAEDVTNPTYVDLVCTDLTHGKNYRLTITPSKIQTAGGQFIIGSNTEDYIGVSTMPVIQTIQTISETEMDVYFTKPLVDDSESVNLDRYSFDKGLQILTITRISESVVRLKTTKQTPSELYTLTVS